jgi:hypothetical protein
MKIFCSPFKTQDEPRQQGEIIQIMLEHYKTIHFFRTTTTRPTLRTLPPTENEGYNYEQPKVRFSPTPKVETKVIAENVPQSTYLPPVAETYLPPETTRLTTPRTTTTR